MSSDRQELSNIHDVYAKMKTTVSASSGQSVSSIDLIRKNLVPDLYGTVMDLYKWQQREVGHVFLQHVWSRVRCCFNDMLFLVRM